MNEHTAAVTATKRNQSMECAKLIASFFVVFIHAQFPGDAGGFVACLARCAVPLFFAISGYFSFQTRADRLVRRMKHILLLTLMGIGAELLWGCISMELGGGSTIAYLRMMIPSVEAIAKWIVLCTNPFGGALWYLTAAFYCYCVLWAYVRFFGEEPMDYRPLYGGGMFLFAMNLAMGVFATAAGHPLTHTLYRNGLFFGIPMFAMGIFLRQYGQMIWERYSLSDKKLILMIFGGLLLGVIEWRGIGASDAHIGTVIAVAALMLLMARNPQVTSRKPLEKLIFSFGSVSTYIYILHPVVIQIYQSLLKTAFSNWLGIAELWLNPVVILILSVMAAAATAMIVSGMKKCGKKIQK